MGELRKVGIAFDETKEKARKSALHIKKWLEKKSLQVFVDPKEEIFRDLDFIITFGGDGFILRWANRILQNGYHRIPLLRVNFGTLGALANIEPEEVLVELKRVLEDNYIITERTRIRVEVRRKGCAEGEFFDALNEIVIERTETRVVSVEIAIIGRRGNEEEFKARGDAIIFATRTGSTAYNESAGGPTLLRENNFILRVVAPTDRESVPFKVVPSDCIFRIKKIVGKVRLVVDGQGVVPILKDGDSVVIQKAPISTYFMEVGDVDKE